MIIGITGKQGAGKDTVAKMLRLLFSFVQRESDEEFKKIVVDEGKTEGKGYYHKDIKWSHKKFATPVYSLASEITGVGIKYMDRKWKNSPLGLKWDRWYLDPKYDEPIQYYKTSKEARDSFGGYYEPRLNSPTGRDLLKAIGHGLRENFHPDIWVNCLMNHYDLFTKYARDRENAGILGPYFYPRYIISDLRYDNEAQAIKNRGGFIIEVHRKDLEEDDHASNSGINSKYVDAILYNNGTIGDLYDSIDILIHESTLINYLPNGTDTST